MSMKKALEINCVPDGTIHLPPSKSLSHRALICGALAGEGTILGRLGLSGEDVAATLSCLVGMGLKYRKQGAELAVTEGIGSLIKDELAQGAKVLDCGESGSTLRFLIPLALLSGASVTMRGRGRLMQRPLKEFMDALDANGGSVCLEGQNLSLQGPLRPGSYVMRGDVSSQFVSGLLMALPLLDGDSDIRLTTILESSPYVDMTIDVMEHFGVRIERCENGYLIPGRQTYKAASYTVEGDYSAGAYFLVAGALGFHVDCAGLSMDSLQGDREILDFIGRCGGRITGNESGTIGVTADRLHGITADISQCPDLAPPLAVLLSFCKGESRILGAGRLRMKESDRLKSITEALNGLGAKITEGPDYLHISGVDELAGGTVDPQNDHRIAMAGALASLKSRETVTVLNPDCVNKSYPDFWKDFCRQEVMKKEKEDKR